MTAINTAKTVYNQWNHQLRERRKQILQKLLPPVSRIRTIEYNQPKPRQQRFRRNVAPTRMIGDLDGPLIVVNLSGITLKAAKTNLLSRGLSFCPTPHHIDKERVLDDLEG